MDSFPLKSNNLGYVRDIEMENKKGTEKKDTKRKSQGEWQKDTEIQRDKGGGSCLVFKGFLTFCVETSGTQLCCLDAGGL